MSANQRIKILISYLKDNKKIRNQQDFVERIGSDKSTVSQIINEKIAVPNSLFEICYHISSPFILRSTICDYCYS